MTTALVLVGGFATLSVLGALFGSDSRDHRWSITRAAVVHPAVSPQPTSPRG